MVALGNKCMLVQQYGFTASLEQTCCWNPINKPEREAYLWFAFYLLAWHKEHTARMKTWKALSEPESFYYLLLRKFELCDVKQNYLDASVAATYQLSLLAKEKNYSPWAYRLTVCFLIVCLNVKHAKRTGQGAQCSQKEAPPTSNRTEYRT